VSELTILVADVEAARERVLAAVEGLTPAKSTWKPAPDKWSVAEILEHLVLAEQSGLEKIYRALESPATEANPNLGLSIEAIIERTWKGPVAAPPVATPQGAGTLDYWRAAFRACSLVVADLANKLEGKELSAIIFPHFLCGPLDARQRLEFLRFHMDRHLEQIRRVLARDKSDE